jgi:hypothetical protein
VEATLSTQLRALIASRATAETSAADVQWQLYGETSTAWFHQFVSNSKGKVDTGALTHVIDTDGTQHSLVDPQQHPQAVAALKGYWADIFQSHQVSVTDQDELLDALDRKLDQPTAFSAEGPMGQGLVTCACLSEALRLAPNNKRPGKDGLPYEFYSTFWDLLSKPLVDTAAAIFEDTGSAAPLPPSMKEGVITLIFKGGNKNRAHPANYRPITLLNTDYKLIAKAIAQRMGGPLDAVVDVTQTAFLPGRQITDNVMYHLEEIDYLEEVQQPGCILFLDFEKAFDRVNREWIHRCIQALGFGEHMQRWVRVLLMGTTSQVLYNGFLTDYFAVEGSVPQGSPLSPSLYIAQSQPLHAQLRKLQRDGRIDAITLPDGTLAPPCHQHADDTTIHTATVASAAIAIAESVQVYCRAAAAKLNISKSSGMTLGSHPSLQGLDLATGATFIAPGETIRHLGIQLTSKPSDQPKAAASTFTKGRGALLGAAKAWQKHGLTFVGRVHVAKVAMASIIYYHAGVIPAPADVMKRVVGTIAAFMARPTSLLDGSQRHATHPSRAVASLPPRMGGIGAPNVSLQVNALLAKSVARLLHPSRQPVESVGKTLSTDTCPAGAGISPAFLPYSGSGVPPYARARPSACAAQVLPHGGASA